MAIVGFNINSLENVYTAIKNSRRDVSEKIASTLQTEILNPMGEAWWAKEAVDYWKGVDGKGFQPAVDKCEKKIEKAYESFAKQIAQSVQYWEKNTGSNFQVKLFSVENSFEINLDYSCIKSKQEDGTVGIDETKAGVVENNLPTVKNKIKSQLGNIAKKLEGVDTLFLGKKQAQNVKKCFEEVNEAISELFSFLSEGGANGKSLKQVIKAYVDKYGDVAKEVNKSFEIKK